MLEGNIVDVEAVTGQPTGLSAIMVLLLSVTVPPKANRHPLIVAPAFAMMENCARTIPWRVVPTPRVTLDPVCHNTLSARPPPAIITLAPTDVMNVVPI